MTKAYGALMEVLLTHRDGFINETEFRAFALESIRAFIQDLRGFGIEISLRPEAFDMSPRPQVLKRQKTTGPVAATTGD